ncbi:MAG: hypothetical protein II718_08575 [Clostridiales bacterium]|nr:hypothetical protein [Clostridiales bacterium]
MISVPMALTDYVPVILYIVSAVILQRGLYDRMSKGAFALFSAGTIMSITAGLFKATWKLLMALEICDFERLSQCFFPMQSVGFLLAGIAVIGLVFVDQKLEEKAVAVYSGTMIFVSLMILGMLGLCVGLSVEAKRRKKTSAMVMFIIAFVFMLTMGYLSTRDFEQASMNWIAQGVNTVGWLVFLCGSRILTKKEA